jgi:hypothetical protein
MTVLDKNSLLFWYPLVRDLPIPQPRTVVYTIPMEDLEVLRTEGLPDGFVDKVHAVNTFGYPVFLRTDQASAKHQWERGAFVGSREMLNTCLFETISHNLCVGLFGLPFIAIVLREYIPMQFSYKAFRGMPVNPERRYFVQDGEVVCHHAYWIEDAITAYGNTKLPENWQKLSADMNSETPKEIHQLTNYAAMVAERLRGFWSVDFCMAADGRWLLIDCAQGKSSWHPADCPHYVEPEGI